MIAMSQAAASALMASHAGSIDPTEVATRWLDSRTPQTRRAYAAALQAFACWAIDDRADAGAVLRLLCELGAGGAVGVVEGWRDHMLQAGLAPATVSCRMSAVRSLHAACRRAGAVSWSLEPTAPRPECRQDRSGPRPAVLERLREAIDDAAAGGDLQAVRDAAVLRLLYSAGLRRSEVGNLRFPDDVDLENATVRPRRKGHRERSAVTVGKGTVEALRRWLDRRGTEAGWLFFRTDRDDRTRPLSGDGIRRLLASWARRAGIRAPIRPHGLRHAGCTAIAERSGSVSSLMAYGGWVSTDGIGDYLDRSPLHGVAAAALVDI